MEISPKTASFPWLPLPVHKTNKIPRFPIHTSNSSGKHISQILGKLPTERSGIRWKEAKISPVNFYIKSENGQVSYPYYTRRKGDEKIIPQILFLKPYEVQEFWDRVGLHALVSFSKHIGLFPADEKK